MRPSYDTDRATGHILFRKVYPKDEIEYLLLQATKKLHWCPPKGHVEPGESDYEAAVRETKEETGLSEEDYTVIPKFKCELRYDVRNKMNRMKHPKTVVYWCAKLINSDKEITISREHRDFKWLKLEEAKELSGFTDLNKCFDICESKIKSL